MSDDFDGEDPAHEKGLMKIEGVDKVWRNMFSRHCKKHDLDPGELMNEWLKEKLVGEGNELKDPGYRAIAGNIRRNAAKRAERSVERSSNLQTQFDPPLDEPEC